MAMKFQKKYVVLLSTVTSFVIMPMIMSFWGPFLADLPICDPLYACSVNYSLIKLMLMIVVMFIVLMTIILQIHVTDMCQISQVVLLQQVGSWLLLYPTCIYMEILWYGSWSCFFLQSLVYIRKYALVLVVQLCYLHHILTS